MNWLAGVVVQLLKWLLPLAVHEIMDWYNERKHQKAMEALKKAEDEEEQKKALDELAKHP